ncbi:hypothetical protein Pcaca03_16180 [Pectobacterium carotovorum subsp. carotovorum]|uniref:Uncharacterized protein n=1 Tax=Pectobacterium carotovorum subsp. carotovorum TaxID=555 RepID=A0AAI9L151_PECCC|nr:hypothetical protein SOASR016_14800 [Pectobacterium carotovorum subsp. carotovorum]GLV69174.1 hypothetical protein Pcaca03_16180 [Pectobacterium carotovorum subsp. carotovorum]GLY63322.1 hypothetical protein Pcaca05_41790 [Pectobacterium carotovorum subsp. carotovorum]
MLTILELTDDRIQQNNILSWGALHVFKINAPVNSRPLHYILTTNDNPYLAYADKASH